MDAPNFPQQGSHEALGVTFTTNFKVKTQLCRNFIATGGCKYGHACIFAHSSKDMRRNEVLGRNQNGVNESMSNMGSCRFFLTNKGCPYGNRCLFKHQGLEKSCDNMVRERYAIDIQTRNFDVNTNPCLKTKLCRRWKMHNGCPYGAKCNYAHGNAELVQSANSTMMTEKKDDLPCDESNQTVEHDIPQKTCLLKWKTMKKIVGIYGDWIDED